MTSNAGNHDKDRRVGNRSPELSGPAQTASQSGEAGTTENDYDAGLKIGKVAYLLEMLKEMHRLSTTIDEPMVTYLLEMAILETNTVHTMLDGGLRSEDLKELPDR